MAVVPLGGSAYRLADMPTAELAQTLSILDEPADEADLLKRRGFYVDMDRRGRIREPSEITEPEVESQLGRARKAAASIFVLLGTDAPARLADPPAEAIEFAEELVIAATRTKEGGSPQDAAEVIKLAVQNFRGRST